MGASNWTCLIVSMSNLMFTLLCNVCNVAQSNNNSLSHQEIEELKCHLTRDTRNHEHSLLQSVRQLLWENPDPAAHIWCWCDGPTKNWVLTVACNYPIDADWWRVLFTGYSLSHILELKQLTSRNITLFALTSKL